MEEGCLPRLSHHVQQTGSYEEVVNGEHECVMKHDFRDDYGIDVLDDFYEQTQGSSQCQVGDPDDLKTKKMPREEVHSVLPREVGSRIREGC